MYLGTGVVVIDLRANYHQKSYRNANCITRGGMVSVNSPKVDGECNARLGLMKLTLLKALKASARNCSRWPSQGILNDLATAMSKLVMGARRSTARAPV